MSREVLLTLAATRALLAVQLFYLIRQNRRPPVDVT
jgi:hypothetical protein